MPTRIQDEPESTFGRRPERLHDDAGHEAGAVPEERAVPTEAGRVTRSGGALRREQADESEFAGEIREREQDEPVPLQGLDE